MVATSLVFFPAAPFFLFMHGKDITIPKGTEITAYIAGDTPLDPAKFNKQSAAVESVRRRPDSSATAMSAVAIDRKSKPPHFLIRRSEAIIPTIERKIVGNAPATVQLVPKRNTVTIAQEEPRVFQTAVWQPADPRGTNGGRIHQRLDPNSRKTSVSLNAKHVSEMLSTKWTIQ